MGHKDDRQREEVYAAERAVDWSAFGANENLGELEDVWVYIDRFMARQSFKRRYPETHSRFNRTNQGWKSKPQRYHERSSMGYTSHPYVVGNSSGKLHGIKIMPTSRGGRANGDTIWLNKWARQKWVVIHELAHVVDRNENGRPRAIWHQGHGWQFAAIYLRLVGTAFGYGAEKALRASFKEHGVKYSQPKTERTARHPRELSDRWVTGW